MSEIHLQAPQEYSFAGAAESNTNAAIKVPGADNLKADVADHVCVMESGKTVWKDTAEKARDSADLIDALLGLQEKER